MSLLLAAVDTPPEGSITAGTIGGIFFVLMAVASGLLWWNMNSRLKRMQKREELERAQQADNAAGEI